MKNTEIKQQDAFQNQLKSFKMMLLGSRMAKGSSICLIILSIALMFLSGGDSVILFSLLIGAITLIVFVIKFLSLEDIEQKKYTSISFPSTISKFKTYIDNRKKYEMYFMNIWIVSLIPFASFYLGSKSEAVIGALICIFAISFLGWLAFKKVDKDLEGIESVMLSN